MRLSVLRPSPAQVRRFLDRQRHKPFSYQEIGITTRGPAPAGYRVDHNRIRLGEGAAVFDRAVGALEGWAMFRLGWAELVPPGARAEPGAVVGVLARAYGAWGLFACRVIDRIEEHGALERRGFLYGTLRGHWLAGEERFLVEWDREKGSVWFDLRAYSRPGGPLARAILPLLRLQQARFGPEAVRAMARAVAGGTEVHS